MEITKYNFVENLDNITKNLKKSCFVAFDAEFTAILAGEAFKYRLFDTNEERYDRIKTEVNKMIMTQIGLTMFHYERERDSYVAVGYTFYLCPQSFGDIDQSFVFQASTLDFLCKHKFDFNKFIYEGLPFLSKAELAKVQQDMKNKTFLSKAISSLDMADEKLLQQYCSEVSKWLCNSDEGTMYLDIEKPLMRYIVHNEIRSRFPDVLTTDSLGNSKMVLIYRDKNVESANSAPILTLEENLINCLLGFSRIISLLETYKKPIVGHNLYLDLVLLHNQFIGPLPKKYSTFKNNIHNMFPKLYDTKFIAWEMGKKLKSDEVWKSTALQDLYEFFSEGKCKKLQNELNFIKLSTPFNVKQTYHEAGWDSYCTGHIFIRFGHWAASENRGRSRAVGPVEKLAALAHYCNKVNIIRGAVQYVNMSGVDPARHRPAWLYVRTLREQLINVDKVASILSSFGSIDVKPHGYRSALIAANSDYTVEKILKRFNNDSEYRISRYSVYRHTTAGRVAVWYASNTNT
ncbi:hypothetical protein O3G_MSEX005463 [Manduca sexta]|uniref:Uncharacterized protein n=3 Tax=Manduca sexta TaxID=7130 RepID=A0A922CJJ0_MANSE|nr:hypothetical protein O3G_MSEX005463 [Manduca sexta]